MRAGVAEPEAGFAKKIEESGEKKIFSGIEKKKKQKERGAVAHGFHAGDAR